LRKSKLWGEQGAGLISVIEEKPKTRTVMSLLNDIHIIKSGSPLGKYVGAVIPPPGFLVGNDECFLQHVDPVMREHTMVVKPLSAETFAEAELSHAFFELLSQLKLLAKTDPHGEDLRFVVSTDAALVLANDEVLVETINHAARRLTVRPRRWADLLPTDAVHIGAQLLGAGEGEEEDDDAPVYVLVKRYHGTL
jgi:hypothetical protein